ncbi:MAG TPA: polysaccharide lyase family protein, partial [Acidobacteriaceae bacterium]|nr:polysaccharide lyase family protein [Acidobacteriaceae bacterium]
MKLKTAALYGFILLTLPGCSTRAAIAQTDNSNAVFTIGKFDHSSVEFAGGAPHTAVDFIVGKSTPAKDWHAQQPVATISASTEQNAPPPAAPWAIHFFLDHAPAAAYRLHIALLIENPSVPALRVAINGKQGTFYLQPKLDYSGGDQVDAFNASTSHADVVFDLPGSYLHSGSNTITLEAVEASDKALPDASLVPNAGLTYDAIELDRSPNAIASNTSSAQILPTIFFLQQQGRLEETVDVILHYREGVKPGGSVELTIAGKHYRQTIAGGQDFGDEKLAFSIPEFPAHTQAQLRWSLAGHTQHEDEFIDPQKKWTLFVVPHIHLDVGYSDFQAKVAAIQSRVIDEAMDLTAQHPDFR